MAKRTTKKAADAAEAQPDNKVIVSPIKTVYSYSPTTGEYAGETQAYRCPVELDKYHIPAHATEVAPPEFQEGKIRVWNGKEWTYETIKA